MNPTILPVRSPSDFNEFLRFPWKVYAGDPCWVPPLDASREERLDPQHTPFWRNATREMWLARRGQEVVGTICAAWLKDNAPGAAGYFGFFEALNDRQAAIMLQDSAAAWLRQKGAGVMRGPYNPSPLHESGVLIYGFNTRPSLLEGHNPSYYRDFFESNGFYSLIDRLARICKAPPGLKSMEEIFPARLAEMSRRVIAKRPELSIRPIDMGHWSQELDIVCNLYNQSLSHVRDFSPVPRQEFHHFAEGFKSYLIPDMVLIAELAGKPVGFVLAIPDANEILYTMHGKTGPLGGLSLPWRIRHTGRACFKMMVLRPEFQGGGIEAVMVYHLSQAIFKNKFSEVEMALPEDDNPKSSKVQDHIGFKIYRRYRIYQKNL
jgi:hypothetical protein